MAIKVIQAIKGMPELVTESEVEQFLLKSKLNIQIATIDEEGYPIVQPIWFLFNRDTCKIYSGTSKAARKIENIKRNPDKVYFSVDDENLPYKGVKGRAEARIIEGANEILPILKTINMKYLGTNDHPIAQMILDNARKGDEVLIELTPKFFSAWDFAKSQR